MFEFPSCVFCSARQIWRACSSASWPSPLLPPFFLPKLSPLENSQLCPQIYLPAFHSFPPRRCQSSSSVLSPPGALLLSTPPSVLLSSFHIRLHVSPQDSTSSAGSAELTGIKELDDLSQEIAQLQRWAPALRAARAQLCFPSSEQDVVGRAPRTDARHHPVIKALFNTCLFTLWIPLFASLSFLHVLFVAPEDVSLDRGVAVALSFRIGHAKHANKILHSFHTSCINLVWMT